jgi:uncharacterized protein
MTRDEAVARLEQHVDDLKRLSLHPYLFGSTARDQVRADSVIDLFFDHQKEQAR